MMVTPIGKHHIHMGHEHLYRPVLPHIRRIHHIKGLVNIYSPGALSLKPVCAEFSPPLLMIGGRRYSGQFQKKTVCLLPVVLYIPYHFL